jgi:hypothetical protein
MGEGQDHLLRGGGSLEGPNRSEGWKKTKTTFGLYSAGDPRLSLPSMAGQQPRSRFVPTNRRPAAGVSDRSAQGGVLDKTANLTRSSLAAPQKKTSMRRPIRPVQWHGVPQPTLGTR